MILVTGAAGFIGYHTVKKLITQGTQVIACDHIGHFFTRRRIADTLFMDRAQLELERYPITGIIHLGAITDTRCKDEVKLKQWNVEFSKTLWNHAAQKKIPFIYASSAATYGRGELGFSDDEYNLHPINPYGASKQAFDRFALDAQIKPPHWLGFKFFNVYGPGEEYKGAMASVVTKAYHAINKTGRLELFQSHVPGIEHGHQKRDFIFIDDVVATLLSALLKKSPSGIYNLGSGKARTFLDLAHAVFRTLKKEPTIDFVPMPDILRSGYQYFTEARMEKLASTQLAFPSTSLEEGVAQSRHAHYSF